MNDYNEETNIIFLEETRDEAITIFSKDLFFLQLCIIIILLDRYKTINAIIYLFALIFVYLSMKLFYFIVLLIKHHKK